MPIETDVLVVGAGPGGYVGAIKLGQLGKKALLVDKDKLGGECLNYGCIPSKALIQSAATAHKPRKSAGFDPASAPAPDWAKVQQWKTGLIGGFQRGIAGLAKGNSVDIKMGALKFLSSTEAELTGAGAPETIRFVHALIVTGSRPVTIPGFAFDGNFILSSREALELTAAPKSLVVIGGGVIGLEIGTFYAKLGTKVTVVEFMPQLLPGVEADLLGPVTRGLEKLGVEVLLEAKAREVREEGGVRRVIVDTAKGERAIEAEKILVSVGRTPTSQGLGLEAAGVKTDSRGHILVDARYRTSAENIYAAGDVIGAPLAHKASRSGSGAHAIGRAAEPLGAVPWAVFTDPEIAFVGETEAQARARGASVLTGRFPFSALGRAQAGQEAEGFVKVIVDRDSHKLLGTGIVGAHASDLISEASLALRLGATVEDIASTIHPHPTFPEAFQEAAEACLGQAIHILPPRR